MSTRRALGVVCAIASVWTALLLATGGFAVRVWSIPIASRAPRTPLLIAVVSGLAAWALALTAERAGAEPPSRGVRRVRLVLLLSVLVLGLNTLLLTQPPPPPGVNGCAFVRELGWGFRHLLNCDALEFLALAREPSKVLTRETPSRQTRPLSFGAPYLVSRPLRLSGWLVESGPYAPYAPEFVAFALINLAVLVATLLCFTRLLQMAGTGTPPGMEVLFSLVVLTANDITKLFFFSPHTQLFNLFVPCVTLYVNARLLVAGRQRSLRSALLLGVGCGVGLLMYGSFLIPLACACAIQLIVHRRIVPAFATGVAAAATYLAWVAYVRLTAGFFYNHETEMYRQFVWLFDCWAAPADRCVPKLMASAWAFVNTFSLVTVVPLALICGVRVARYVWPGTAGTGRPVRAEVGQSLAWGVAATAVFLALMGVYLPRLFWLFIPPVLLVLAIELQLLRAAMSTRQQRMLSAVVFVASLVYLAVLVSRWGPYT